VKAKLREDRAPAVSPNDVWAMDFVHDQLATGRKLRILTVVDTHSRVSSVIDPRFSYRGEDVVATLEKTCRVIGYPKVIRVDNVLHSDTQASFGRRSSSRIFQIRALKSIAGWASATMEELSAIANTGSMRSVVAGPHRP
jgi:transposase InsO family protein